MLRAKVQISSRRSGFTLVEMLVIAPIALLVITGFVALMVVMVGDVIASRTYNTMTYEVQDALNTIERDVRLSTEFLTTSGSLPPPQGKNSGISPFVAENGDLILGSIATTKNPLDPTRQFAYYNTPFACSNSAELHKNRIFFVTVSYFLNNGSLWRRTYVPTAGGTLCQPAWQVNTCAPGYPSSATRCQTNDSEILKNVSSFNVSYYENPGDTVPISPSTASQASTIRVSLESQRTAAGRSVEASSAARSSKLSSREINLPPPDAPSVTSSRSGTDAIFSWPGVPNATSYIIRYNINGANWITASENSTETTFSVPAHHGDIVSVEVRARNTTGTSAAVNSSATIPLWNECGLQNNWRNYTEVYGGNYTGCGYTMTKDGVVVVKGLIAQGAISSNVTLFQLPENYRPSQRLIFVTTMGGNAATRVNVETNGNVTLLTTGTAASDYLSLDMVKFIPSSNPAFQWSNLTPQNGWSNFGGGHATLRSIQDRSGRIHLQGVMNSGNFTFGTVIASLPFGQSPSATEITPVRMANGNVNAIYIHGANGHLTSRGENYGGATSVQAMFYPASFNGWQNFSIVPGNPGSGQMGNGWTTYSSSFATPQYTKSDDNIVTVRGVVRGGVGTSFMAVLPPGYRPANRMIFTLVSSLGYARVDVLPDGRIEPVMANTDWTSLSSLSFVAEN